MNIVTVKTKFLFGSLVLCLMIVVTLILNVSNFLKTSKLQHEYQQLESSLEHVHSLTGVFADVKKEHEQRVKELYKNSDKYETELAYLRDLQTLKNNATRYGVEVTALVPKLEDTMPTLKQYISITENYLERYEIELTLKGNFRNVGRFIQFLDTDNRRIYIKEISVFSVDPSIVEVDLRAYSYGLRGL